MTPYLLFFFNIQVNVSIVRQTLKTNNKALARALERARSEIKELGDEVIQLNRDKQALQSELCVLQRVAGLKDKEIEHEVTSRIKVKII